jgi:hypothetical protein
MQLPPPAFTLILPNHRTLSWNVLYRSGHWKKRSTLAIDIHNLVQATLIDQGYTIMKKSQLFTKKVDIVLTAYFARLPIDSDNIASKLYIDGLKYILLHDDSLAYVGKVTTESIKSDKTELHIASYE